MRRIALIALAASIATPALALAHKAKSDAAPDATAATQQAARDKAPEKTCRTYQMSGSHLKPERLCLTREEWRKFDDQQ